MISPPFFSFSVCVHSLYRYPFPPTSPLLPPFFRLSSKFTTLPLNVVCFDQNFCFCFEKKKRSIFVLFLAKCKVEINKQHLFFQIVFHSVLVPEDLSITRIAGLSWDQWSSHYALPLVTQLREGIHPLFFPTDLTVNPITSALDDKKSIKLLSPVSFVYPYPQSHLYIHCKKKDIHIHRSSHHPSRKTNHCTYIPTYTQTYKRYYTQQ